MLNWPSLFTIYVVLVLLFLVSSCSNTKSTTKDSSSEIPTSECMKILNELSHHMHRVKIDSFQTDKPTYTFMFDVLTDRGKQFEAVYWSNLINYRLNSHKQCLNELTTDDVISTLGKPTFSKNSLMYYLHFGDNCPCTRCGTENLYRYFRGCELIRFDFNGAGKINRADAFITGFQFNE